MDDKGFSSWRAGSKIHMNVQFGLLTAILLGAAGPASMEAHDWPRWRGPDLNGISRDTNWSSKALDGEPRILWRAKIGTGFSSFAVADGRVFTSGNEGNTDTVFCFDAATGREIWKQSYAEPLDPHNYVGGPSSTPTVDADTVFQLSRKGQMLALDVRTGAIKWRKNLTNETGVAVPQWGFGGSPLVHGDHLILNVGKHGTALNKTDGALAWITGTNASGYSSPLPFEINGKKGLAIFAAKGIAAVSPATGELQWTYPWETLYDINASDPIFDGSRVFITSDAGRGGALLDVSSGQPERVWANRNMGNQFHSSVLINGHLYGISGSAGKSAESGLHCVELATGKLMWMEKSLMFGALTAAGERLIVIGETGELVLAEANPTKFVATSRAHVMGGRCWTTPVIAHGKVYVRNSRGNVICVDLRP